MLHCSIKELCVRWCLVLSRVRVFLHTSAATRLPAPPSGVPPFVLMRQLEGELLVTPFPGIACHQRPRCLSKRLRRA